MTIGVGVIVAGRRRHLASLLLTLCHQELPPAHTVIVSMDDDDVVIPRCLSSVTVTRIDSTTLGLPLAAARNAAAAQLQTDDIVFLDVDCLASPRLLSGFSRALNGKARHGLVCGELRYIPAHIPVVNVDGRIEVDRLAETARRAPSRPHVAPGELVRNDRHSLAWTTALAMSQETFARIGGFDPGYVGYGAEDTDFTERARRLGIAVWWSGDALAVHRDHSPTGPPVHHLDDIVRNAHRFRQQHGWWPMQGWLSAFADQGLIQFDPDQDLLEIR